MKKDNEDNSTFGTYEEIMDGIQIKTLGELLIEARAERELTINDIVKATGLTVGLITSLEANIKSDLKGSEILILAKSYQLHPIQILNLLYS